MKRVLLLLSIIAVTVFFLPRAGAGTHHHNPNADGVVAWSGDVAPDLAQSGCGPISASVTLNVNSGSLTVNIGQPMKTGSASQSGQVTTHYTPPSNPQGGSGGPTVAMPATNLPGAKSGMTANEVTGTAVPIPDPNNPNDPGSCAALTTAKEQAGIAGDGGLTTSTGTHTLKFDVGDCHYTIVVSVKYDHTGAVVSVAISDGGSL